MAKKKTKKIPAKNFRKEAIETPAEPLGRDSIFFKKDGINGYIDELVNLYNDLKDGNSVRYTHGVKYIINNGKGKLKVNGKTTMNANLRYLAVFLVPNSKFPDTSEFNLDISRFSPSEQDFVLKARANQPIVMMVEAR